ncbi:hypothetical protein [Nocardia elegans]|uniref:hypothetical protein n=1 Tax=Nocardia elegans TaxID=300029 RepID=UPI0011B25FA3|nr:hypothetical protein [Nocardia elegans]
MLSQALGSAWTTVVLDDILISPDTVDYSSRKPLSQRIIDAADPRVAASPPERVTAASERWNEITATVAAHPAEAVKLTGQLAGAWGQLVADNADLANPAVWARLAATVPLHDGYPNGQLASGIAWLVAVAHDLSQGQS